MSLINGKLTYFVCSQMRLLLPPVLLTVTYIAKNIVALLLGLPTVTNVTKNIVVLPLGLLTVTYDTKNIVVLPLVLLTVTYVAKNIVALFAEVPLVDGVFDEPCLE